MAQTLITGPHSALIAALRREYPKTIHDIEHDGAPGERGKLFLPSPILSCTGPNGSARIIRYVDGHTGFEARDAAIAFTIWCREWAYHHQLTIHRIDLSLAIKDILLADPIEIVPARAILVRKVCDIAEGRFRAMGRRGPIHLKLQWGRSPAGSPVVTEARIEVYAGLDGALYEPNVRKHDASWHSLVVNARPLKEACREWLEQNAEPFTGFQMGSVTIELDTFDCEALPINCLKQLTCGPRLAVTER